MTSGHTGEVPTALQLLDTGFMIGCSKVSNKNKCSR